MILTGTYRYIILLLSIIIIIAILKLQANVRVNDLFLKITFIIRRMKKEDMTQLALFIDHIILHYGLKLKEYSLPF